MGEVAGLNRRNLFGGQKLKKMSGDLKATRVQTLDAERRVSGVGRGGH